MSGKKVEALRLRFKRAEARLIKLVDTAGRRGYTGMVGSRGGFLDDPLYRKAMRQYDRTLADYHRASDRVRRRTKTRSSR